VVVAAVIAVVVWLSGGEEKTVEAGKPETKVATGTADAKPEPKKAARRHEPVSKWERLGVGTVVGVVREYGTEKPVGDLEVTLEAGLPGPNQNLKAKTGADGGFSF